MKVFLASLAGLTLFACQGKLDTKENGSKTESSQVAPATADTSATTKATKNLEVVAPEVVIGVWSSQCIPDVNNDVRPGAIVQYQFGPNGAGLFKILSYKDAACDARYTKADVDKLRARLQADAATAGLPPPGEKELQAFDVLWIPPTTKFQYKLGYRFTNKLMELDLTPQGANGPETTIYTSFYFNENLWYFSETCSAVDSFAGRCSPVVGDQADRRGKKVDFNIGYEKQNLPLDPL